MKVCLIGATFATGNLGVSALAASSVQSILSKWPDAQIFFYGMEGKNNKFSDVPIKYFTVFRSKNIFLKNNYYRLLFIGYLRKFLPESLSAKFCNSNSYVRDILEFDLVLDITGGDSFSDIYGFNKFFNKFLIFYLFKTYNIRYVLLPQTFGPFKSSVAKYLAKVILEYADPVYCRDSDSYQLVQDFLGDQKKGAKVKQFPDVAFLLKSTKPMLLDEVDKLHKMKENAEMLVGLNISGLLFNGGHNGNNMFNLKVDYKDFIYRFVETFLKEHNLPLVLVPHVVTSKGHFENDKDACEEIYQSFKDKYPNRIFPIRDHYNQSEIKYAIGCCDFFLGSRMHSCIAALSQEIPAIGLAYSKKFKGVFESIGCGDLVIDLRTYTTEQAIERINQIIKDRKKYVRNLEMTIPKAKRDLESLF